MSLVLVPTRIDLGDQSVEVGVSPQRALRNQLLPTGGTLFVPAAEKREHFRRTRVGGGDGSQGLSDLQTL